MTIGPSDTQGAQLAERQLTIGELVATFHKAFGIDWTKQHMSPISRPLKTTNPINGTIDEPIKELV